MSEVRVGELNQQTGRVLRRVQAGESLVVTDHGRPVAMLVPAPKSKFKQLEMLGYIKPPRNTSGRLAPVKRVKLSRSTDEILAEIRADKV
jgi:prevent-host-death family protein